MSSDLVALDVNVLGRRAVESPASLAVLETALSGLAGLRKLKIASYYISVQTLQRFVLSSSPLEHCLSCHLRRLLIPLAALEVLDLGAAITRWSVISTGWRRLAPTSMTGIPPVSFLTSGPTTPPYQGR